MLEQSRRHPPVFATPAEERVHRKQRLAGAFRLFASLGYDEGAAGHITVRDPEDTETFWVNPFGTDFSQIRVSDLLRIDHRGIVVEGKGVVNTAAFVIHGNVHCARPEVTAAAHAHSTYGKAWSTLGRKLDPITQDSCAFYGDHGLFDRYTGVVYNDVEGKGIAEALGTFKAVILKNHGLLAVGHSVDEAAWWFIAMDRSCHVQLLAEAAGTPALIEADMASLTASQVGRPEAGYFAFQALFDRISAEQPDLFE